MASSPPAIEQTFDVDKLSYEIFSILESKFLFGYDDTKLFLPGSLPSTPTRSSNQSPSFRVRILSIDGGGRFSDALLAASALARLETTLRERSGDSMARISDFFDCAAGSGAGGVLASMLFARGPTGKSLFSAGEAFAILSKEINRNKGLFHGIFNWSSKSKKFRKMFNELTLKDAVKPLLVPCYDLATGAPFLFSRADAMENSSFNFKLSDVCEATCEESVEVRSVDARRKILAVGGGIAMGNPTAAAITHVLNNKKEFPLAGGVEDLLVVSLGSGEAEHGREKLAVPPSQADIVRIASEGVADVVDQAVAMAFGHSRSTNYIRIQASGSAMDRTDNHRRAVLGLTEKMLSQKNVESVLFRGKKISDKTNAEKLDYFAHELMKEHDRRRTNSGTDDSGDVTFFPVPAIKEVKVVVPRQSIESMQSVPSFKDVMVPIVPAKTHSALVGRVISSIL
ncbi:Patatin [Rhynchospora pubera]|uniref:Patatin n=1 Tax=Rhynchospora pubera TaxID=906938 RepID=A0AAV8ENB5_9POAL|nr:Patatin [Rhynchospora pubera]KAJ4781041.1 Patatin [Rhynchospora pubera]